MMTMKEKSILNDNIAEMTESEVGFLLNLIDVKLPKKLVEIGVAAGGTTSIIIEHLKTKKHKCSMFSIDKSLNYYRDNFKKTGYYANDYIGAAKHIVEHEFMIGKYAVEYMEQIGEEIDFLILDTVHSLPGELLDFIGILPYLSDGAVVVLHDTCLNHLSNNISGFATQLLLDVVSGEKIFDLLIDCGNPNIGAFVVSSETRNNINDVFRALLISWNYFPDDEQILIYRAWYHKHYNDYQIEIFNKAVELNRHTINKCRLKNIGELKEIISFMEALQNKNIYIYGCGFWGMKLCKLLLELEMPVYGFIVSDDQKIKYFDCDKPIQHLNDYACNALKTDVIILGVGFNLIEVIEKNLKNIGIFSYIKIPAYMLKCM